MQTVRKDITTVTEGIVVHQVNLMGKMGAGLAYQVRNTWPVVYDAYVKAIVDGSLDLGDAHMVPVSEKLIVVNLVGQRHFRPLGVRHTNYIAVGQGLTAVRKLATHTGLLVYIPYKMGCGLGGGDWDVVQALIRDAGIYPFICVP